MTYNDFSHTISILNLNIFLVKEFFKSFIRLLVIDQLDKMLVHFGSRCRWSVLHKQAAIRLHLRALNLIQHLMVFLLALALVTENQMTLNKY